MLRIIIRKTTLLCLFLLIVNGVFGDSDGLKSVSVTEGDSVTLNIDVTELQRNDQILWMFGPRETRIAELYKQNIDMFKSNETFGDRLQIDSQTGSLTIRNIRSEHTGLYKLQILSDRGTSYQRFNVTVHAPLPIPIITSNSSNCSSSSSSSSSRSSVSRCSLLCSAVNVSHVTLSWYKGNSLLSSISVSDLSISLSIHLEVEYKDKNTYSCVINNPIRNQTKHLDNITHLCHTCEDKYDKRLYAALISAVVLAVLAVVMYFLYRKCRRSGPAGNYFKPSVYAAETVQTDQEEKPKGTEETVYSTVMKN
ncbi:CD48 antigen-like isoform X2 [Chanodichthys erythropterus]|uniref:CD48 antigen-like isoform X2 n=1 Tax=Chanodichthys erythropterus TaxID=933992 RepID=UPI00351EED13